MPEGYGWPCYASTLPPPTREPSFRVDAQLASGEANTTGDGGEELVGSRSGAIAIVIPDGTAVGTSDSYQDAPRLPEVSAQVAFLNIEFPHDERDSGAVMVGRTQSLETSMPVTVDRALIQVFLRSVLVPSDFLRTRARNSARAFVNCSAGSALFSR